MGIGREVKSELAERLKETAEDLVDLVSAQVKLVRLELLDDARALGTRLTRVAIFGPLAFLGYSFLAGSAAYALAKRVGWGWALALVGSVHVAAGGWGLLHAARALRGIRVLDRSRDELERSLQRVTAAPPVPPRL